MLCWVKIPIVPTGLRLIANRRRREPEAGEAVALDVGEGVSGSCCGLAIDMSEQQAKVIFTPSGRRGTFPVGTPLLDAARNLGVDIDSVCGGRGLCGRCQIICAEGDFATIPLFVQQSTSFCNGGRSVVTSSCSRVIVVT